MQSANVFNVAEFYFSKPRMVGYIRLSSKLMKEKINTIIERRLQKHA